MLKAAVARSLISACQRNWGDSLDSHVSTESPSSDEGGRQEVSSPPATGRVTVYHTGLHSLLRSESSFDYVIAGAKGTKTSRGDKKQMMQYPVARGCDQGTLDALTAMVEQIGANNRKNETLSGLRDALLPKLMAGVIDVPEVES